MKKIIHLLLITLLAIQPAWADDISAGQAMDIARQFVTLDVKAKAIRRAKGNRIEPRLAHTVKSKTSQKNNVYVINLGVDQGFVIVSGEDGADHEILGYCDKGDFDYDKAPVQLKELLGRYSSGVDSLRANPRKNAAALKGELKAATAEAPASVVGPLLTTTWDQYYPYNKFCPSGPAGCLPVAIAQVMNYWKWPKQSGGQTRPEGQQHPVDFPVHVYDWDNMIDHYDWPHVGSEEQGDAVAQLMADIGMAFHTEYTPEGSATPFENSYLIENFGYDPDIVTVNAPSGKELMDVMKRELDGKRPVLYCGTGFVPEYTHALVVDGYTPDDYFHFNYGWGGFCDGWYLHAVCANFYNEAWIWTGVRPYNGEIMTIGGAKYGMRSDGTAEVLRLDMEEKADIDSLVIPNTIKDSAGKEYPVVRIRKSQLSSVLFRNVKYLKLGDNVREIDFGVFHSCFIDKLVFGDGIESIPAKAFATTTINELIMGSGVKNIGEEAFTGAQIKELVIGPAVKYIGKQAFLGSSIKKITCNSPAIALGNAAFSYAHLPDGDWSTHITELGDYAFDHVTFEKAPHLTNLEWIGKRVLDHTQGYYGDFTIPATVRHIDPEAFIGTQLNALKVDPNSPYFTMPNFAVVCNKSETVLTLVYSNTKCDLDKGFIPETVVKFEPRSIPTRSGYSVTIPGTVEDITGAFSNCEDLKQLTCLAVIPPAAEDNTFSDKLFSNNPKLTLHVPAGTETLYEQAPGWRRFPRIVGDKPYVPAPTPADREYYMVLHCTGADGRNLSRRLPVSKVKDIRVGDYVAQDGQTLIVTAEGQSDACRVDSITWMKGFVFNTSEVFDLDPDHLEAKASDCTVRLSSCVIDGPVQLSVRKAVLSTGIRENAARELALDISLSTGEHEVSGIAEIEVPLTLEEDETLMAAYFNEESGEWEPVLCTYDESTNTARIITDHFSLYDFFTIKNENTRSQFIEAVTYLTESSLMYYTPYQDINSALKTIFDMASSDDPDAAAVDKFKEDFGFWQTVGLDGGYNLIKSIGFDYKSVDDAVGVVGKLGTAMAILDVALADIKGDEAALAANTAKAINSIIGMHLGAIFDASILSATSGLTAFIGIALDKLGTMVQTAKLDYTRAMYRYYYSEKGYEECGPESKFSPKYLRSNKDWFDLLYPYLEKNNDGDKFLIYVEGRVRRYCEQFWEESTSVQTYCEAEAKRLGFSSMLWISDSDKQKVCDEYFAELINGPITQVMSDVRRKLAVKSKKKYDECMKDYVRFLNTQVGFRFRDSSCAEGETSKFSGYKVRFTDTPANVTDGGKWECTIKENGKATLGLFTVYALAGNKIRPQLTLVDDFGENVATFDYELRREGRKIILDFDLAREATPVIRSKNLELEYVPDSLDLTIEADFFFVYDITEEGEEKIGRYELKGDHAFFQQYLKYGACMVRQPEMTDSEKTVKDHEFKVLNVQEEVEKYFRNHESVTIESGKVRIGDDIVGDWDETRKEGNGKFTLITVYPFNKPVEDFVYDWNNRKGYYEFPLLSGSLTHRIECEFNIRYIEEESLYEVTFVGEGDFDLEAERVRRFKNVDVTTLDEYWEEVWHACIQNNVLDKHEHWFWNTGVTLFCRITTDNVATSHVSDKGKVTLNFTKNIKIK